MSGRWISVTQAKVDILSSNVLLVQDLVFGLWTIIGSFLLSDGYFLFIEYVLTLFLLLLLNLGKLLF